MKIIKKEESREQCTEAGWYAYDYTLDEVMTCERICRLRQLGSGLIYLSQLKQPFYKLEEQYFMLKGLEGKNVLRLSMYRRFEDEVCRKTESFLTELL